MGFAHAHFLRIISDRRVKKAMFDALTPDIRDTILMNFIVPDSVYSRTLWFEMWGAPVQTLQWILDVWTFLGPIDPEDDRSIDVGDSCDVLASWERFVKHEDVAKKFRGAKPAWVVSGRLFLEKAVRQASSYAVRFFPFAGDWVDLRAITNTFGRGMQYNLKVVKPAGYVHQDEAYAWESSDGKRYVSVVVEDWTRAFIASLAETPHADISAELLDEGHYRIFGKRKIGIFLLCSTADETDLSRSIENGLLTQGISLKRK